jgi:hypothetical protein
MKTFLGRIITVSDDAGQSVTVSKWGGGLTISAPGETAASCRVEQERGHRRSTKELLEAHKHQAEAAGKIKTQMYQTGLS